jgi:hypothetical protein
MQAPHFAATRRLTPLSGAGPAPQPNLRQTTRVEYRGSMLAALNQIEKQWLPRLEVRSN